jgi:type IV pilus assembly protein PilM
MGRKKGNPLLGIDINQNEICVVNMRGTWPNPQIMQVESVPTPEGAIEGGQIADPDAIGEALRSLLERMGVKTRTAVMGISSRNVTTRVLDVPVVPANELESVVEGEVQHQRILRDAAGGFDFVQLQSAETGPQVLLMAAEEPIINAYRTIAERAGLRLVALEPTLPAMYRSASPMVYSRPSALCLTISSSESEIAIVDEGNIRLYRRVDNGYDQLIGGASDTAAPLSADLNSPALAERKPLGLMDDYDYVEPVQPKSTTAAAAAANNDPFDLMAANNLAIELQRSMDYYKREYPNAVEVSYIVIVSHIPEMAPLSEWLSQALSLEVNVAQIPVSGLADMNILPRLEPPHSMQFLTAAGLAMRELTSLPAGIPQFDLLPTRKADKQEAILRHRLTFALAASVVLLMLGMFKSFTVGQEANKVESALAHLKGDIAQLQQLKSIKLDEIQKQRDLLAVLKRDGLPVPRVSDAIAGTVPPNIALTEVSLNKAGSLTIGGEAVNDRLIITMLEGLKTSPLLQNTSLESFDSTSNNAAQKHLVKFQITSQLVGLKPLKPRGAAGAPAAPKEG